MWPSATTGRPSPCSTPSTRAPPSRCTAWASRCRGRARRTRRWRRYARLPRPSTAIRGGCCNCASTAPSPPWIRPWMRRHAWRLAGIRQQQARLPDPIHEGVTLARMAVAEIHAAGPEQALAHAGASLELTRQSRTPTDIYASLDALAEVHAALGNTRQVLDYTTRKHDMKLASLRGQRLEMLGAIQAGNQDVST